MAEGLLKKELNSHDILVTSAGITALYGMAPTQEAVKVMRDKAGIDISSHLTRGLTSETAESADLILVMEKIHKDFISEKVPSAKDKTYLLKEFGADREDIKEAGIPDPIGRPLEVYEEVYYQIEDAVKDAAKRIKEINL